MTSHQREQQVQSVEIGPESSIDPPFVRMTCETPLVSVPAGPIARVEGGKFAPGRSANPGGKAKGERALLQRMYGREGKKVFQRLEQLRNDPKTPKRLQMQIDFFIVERLFGKAPQMVGVEGGPSLLSLLAEAAARSSSPNGTSS